jgi:hypothetical protein
VKNAGKNIVKRTKMNKWTRLSAQIIDEIEEQIFSSNPRLNKMRFKGNSLLYGIPYYNCEEHIAKIIKNSMRKRKQK